MNSNFIRLIWTPYKDTWKMRLRLIAETCVARNFTSGNPVLVLLKLKYLIFWYGLLSFLSCVLHVHGKKGLYIANLQVSSCSLFDQSNYLVVSFVTRTCIYNCSSIKVRVTGTSAKNYQDKTHVHMKILAIF